jgi:hypothetical protein
MTVILVLATFLAFIVLDYLMNRRKAVVTVPMKLVEAVPAHLGGEMVDGFLVPGAMGPEGQKVLSFYRDGEKTEMVSPTEGEVLVFNAEVLNNPALLRRDPYGKAWLMTLNVPDEENTGRNLVPKG